MEATDAFWLDLKPIQRTEFTSDPIKLVRSLCQRSDVHSLSEEAVAFFCKMDMMCQIIK